MVGTDPAQPDVFEYSHRILSVNHVQGASSHCSTLELEFLHPWELFKSVKVHALIERPFDNMAYSSASPEKVTEQVTEQERDLQSEEWSVTPTAPLLECTNSKYDDNGFFWELKDAAGTKRFRKDNQYGNAQLAMGSNQGCVSLMGKVPGSLSFNYDRAKQRAKEAIQAMPSAVGSAIQSVAKKVPVVGRIVAASQYFSYDFTGVVSCDNCFLVLG